MLPVRVKVSFRQELLDKGRAVLWTQHREVRAVGIKVGWRYQRGRVSDECVLLRVRRAPHEPVGDGVYQVVGELLPQAYEFGVWAGQ